VVIVKHYVVGRLVFLVLVSVLGVLRYARVYSYNDSGAPGGWWEHLFVSCVYIRAKIGLAAEAPLNEMTDNGAHTAK